MSPKDAEKIVNRYGAALATGSENIARKKSLLPCSKAKIRLAFYVYIAELVKRNLLDKNIGNNLITTYAFLHCFIEDDKADEINKIGQKIKSEGTGSVDEQARNKYFYFAEHMIDVETFDEINEYISECRGLK